MEICQNDLKMRNLGEEKFKSDFLSHSEELENEPQQRNLLLLSQHPLPRPKRHYKYFHVHSLKSDHTHRMIFFRCLQFANSEKRSKKKMEMIMLRVKKVSKFLVIIYRERGI
jgi:hypothetical protein